jgi:hypothetical protein
MADVIAEFLKSCVIEKEDVDRWLNPTEPTWAHFDGELGWLLHDSVAKDGIGGSYTLSTFAPTGERATFAYAGRPCRINSYGNSFTQCHQVSDGETWQTYLGAHLGEPIRNFGIGGYGVYQAYRRMLRQEAVTPTQYVLLNIYGLDDHVRSSDRWRRLRLSGYREELMRVRPYFFHSNPWAHALVDLDSGEVREYESLCPTPESLYRLCDMEYVHKTFKDDIQVHITLAREGVKGLDTKLLKKAANVLGLSLDFRTADAAAKSARALQIDYGLKVSRYIVKKADEFAKRSGKKLMVLLAYEGGMVMDGCAGLPRRDAAFVEYLHAEGFTFVDTLVTHVRDYASFKITPEEYIERYYIGHYNPTGNHFFAFAVKDALVEWLDPKPVTYSKAGASIMNTVAKLA